MRAANRQSHSSRVETHVETTQEKIIVFISILLWGFKGKQVTALTKKVQQGISFPQLFFNETGTTSLIYILYLCEVAKTMNGNCWDYCNCECKEVFVVHLNQLAKCMPESESISGGIAALEVIERQLDKIIMSLRWPETNAHLTFMLVASMKEPKIKCTHASLART